MTPSALPWNELIERNYGEPLGFDENGGADCRESGRGFHLGPSLIKPGRASSAVKPLAPSLQPFAGHPGEFSAENYREKYFPGHNYEKVVDPNQPAREVNLLGARNPHVIEQAPFKIPSSKVDEFEKAFDGMLHTSARAITANKAYDELAKIYGGAQKIPQEIRDIFTVKIPATGTQRSFGEKIAAIYQGARQPSEARHRRHNAYSYVQHSLASAGTRTGAGADRRAPLRQDYARWRRRGKTLRGDASRYRARD